MTLPGRSANEHALAILADGIIPADARDTGATSVNAGVLLAKKLEQGAHAELYSIGLALARRLADAQYHRDVTALTPAEVHELLALLRVQAPLFFKQLRMDVCAAYLSAPAVWSRIGFPGPSIDSGGHPDFAQPQEPRA